MNTFLGLLTLVVLTALVWLIAHWLVSPEKPRPKRRGPRAVRRMILGTEAELTLEDGRVFRATYLETLREPNTDWCHFPSAERVEDHDLWVALSREWERLEKIEQWIGDAGEPAMPSPSTEPYVSPEEREQARFARERVPQGEPIPEKKKETL
jgi:hypothetical protein